MIRFQNLNISKNLFLLYFNIKYSKNSLNNPFLPVMGLENVVKQDNKEIKHGKIK